MFFAARQEALKKEIEKSQKLYQEQNMQKVNEQQRQRRKQQEQQQQQQQQQQCHGHRWDQYLAFILIVRYKLNMQYFTIRIIIYTLEYTNHFNVLYFYSFVKK